MSEITISTGTRLSSTESAPLSQRVVEAVAHADGVDETDLDPLFHAIDPDALNALFRPQLQPGETPDETAEIRFHYHGYEVRVTAVGTVELSER